jgi:hypothetical protein
MLGWNWVMVKITCWLILAAAIFIIPATPVRAAEPLPPFSQVQGVVAAHFQSIQGFAPSDLISRSQVDVILAELGRLHWKVADAEKIRTSVLDDDNYLVQQLRTPDGERFMRKVSAQPLAYDRLDQITRMPSGQLMIKDFLRFPNSEVSFTRGGTLPFDRLTRLTPPDQRAIAAADMDKPTGRIYTIAQLVARLRVSYDAELARRQSARP